jgi:hypothetical protein
VFSVVRKDQMKWIKKERWDLVSSSAKFGFTKFTPCLGIYSYQGKHICPFLCNYHVWCVLQHLFGSRLQKLLKSEFADVTDNVLKLPAMQPFLQFFTSPYFLSLSITDQPYEKPRSPAQCSSNKSIKKHVILTLSVPTPARAGDTLPMVTAIFNVIDTLGNISLRPETKAKIKKAREDFEKLVKQEIEREKKETVRLNISPFS